MLHWSWRVYSETWKLKKIREQIRKIFLIYLLNMVESRETVKIQFEKLVFVVRGNPPLDEKCVIDT